MAESRYGNNAADFHMEGDGILMGIRRVALECLTRYGLKRTSMREIAELCRISPAALYHRFSSKQALSDALGRWVVDCALRDADQPWSGIGSLYDGLLLSIRRRDDSLRRLMHETPHGAELIMPCDAETPGHVSRLVVGFADLLAPRIARFPEAAEAGGGGPRNLGLLLSETTFLMLCRHSEAADYEARVDQLCRLAAPA